MRSPPIQHTPSHSLTLCALVPLTATATGSSFRSDQEHPWAQTAPQSSQGCAPSPPCLLGSSPALPPQGPPAALLCGLPPHCSLGHPFLASPNTEAWGAPLQTPPHCDLGHSFPVSPHPHCGLGCPPVSLHPQFLKPSGEDEGSWTCWTLSSCCPLRNRREGDAGIPATLYQGGRRPVLV